MTCERCASLYDLQGVRVNAEVLSVEHGREVLQTAVDAVQVVHKLQPGDTNTVITLTSVPHPHGAGLFNTRLIWAPTVLLCYSVPSGGRGNSTWAEQRGLHLVSCFITVIAYPRDLN